MRILFLSIALICGLAGQAKAYFSYMPASNRTSLSDVQSIMPPSVRPVQPQKQSLTPLKAASPVVSSASSTMGKQNTVLPKAILTVLPYDWRYIIPDAPKHSLQVSWPENVPWREAIRSMANEADCTAQFDEKARRVTLASVVTPATPVSALHPASLPSESTVTTATSKPEATHQAKVEPKVIQDALADATYVPSASPIKESAPPTVATVVEQRDLSVTSVTDVTPPVPAASWVITPGPLKRQMETWAEQAGYHVVWKSNYDYMMQVRSAFSGDFITAVTAFFEHLHIGGNTGVRVTLHQNNKIMEVRHE